MFIHDSSLHNSLPTFDSKLDNAFPNLGESFRTSEQPKSQTIIFTQLFSSNNLYFRSWNDGYVICDKGNGFYLQKSNVSLQPFCQPLCTRKIFQFSIPTEIWILFVGKLLHIFRRQPMNYYLLWICWIILWENLYHQNWGWGLSMDHAAWFNHVQTFKDSLLITNVLMKLIFGAI